MANNDTSQRILWSVLMFVAMIFWGMSWPFSKLLTQQASPYLIAFLRFAAVSITFIPVILFLKLSFKIPKNTLKMFVSVSLFNALYSLFFFVGLGFGFAGKAGVITVTLSPILTALFAAIYYKTHLLGREKIGLLIGLILGGFLLQASSFETLFSPFNLFFVAAATSWAILTIISRHLSEHLHPIVLNFYTSLLSALWFFPVIFIQDMSILLEVKADFWLDLFIIAVLSTAIGTSIFYKGVSVLGINQGASFTLITPLSALFFSFVILGEIPQWQTLIGGTGAIIAIYFISLYQSHHFKFFKKELL
ncbi:DMT family transporter [Helicobacter sp. MIT 05-5293]|uniref:DMT family transporter n=1 Tax=Helicobacter sp. MIT 05-5293 TaxID=1548149 RepID=UPI000689B0FC|nr:DMT family transporter [Helicobacter sp. MIT 05-5293]TLD82167.1 DMT family transporter [Helicobacter sp. MIT 05-5293]